jgi:thioredoxin 1
MASDILIDIDESNFQAEIIESDVPVLVDFWADWCSPCKALTPTLEKVAQKYEGRAKIVKLNTQTHPKLAQRCNVRMLPTLLLYKQGQVKGQIVGLVPEKKITDLIEGQL